MYTLKTLVFRAKTVKIPMYRTASYRIRTSWFNGLFRTLFDLLVEWNERAIQRRQLAEMDPRMLKDIGITHTDAWHKSNKPFWRA
ncbi:MAG: hypothetical protein CL569_06350 [Alphaproteobacteria bacterium]|nr:hypothetical protein [Alphaproteobacteria bacterium]|tara:strand:- start:323 stop:577 length:255 start_codon:yes stop_codon:yes gene_type:complete